MLIKEHPYVNKQGNECKNLVKHYSDEGFYIIQNETGNKYIVAIDAYPCTYTYSETSEVAPPLKTFTKEQTADA